MSPFYFSAVGAVAVRAGLSENYYLFVCGGFDGVSSLDTVERYDPVINKWTLAPSMNKHRSAAGVVELDGRIFALGGHNGLSIFESVEVLNDPLGLKGPDDPLGAATGWREAAPMLSKRCRLGVAALGGAAYAAGG